MKYPKYLENQLQEITAIVKSWPIEKSVDEVMAWILQFERSDYDLALRVLKNLNVIGADDLNVALSVAYSKLLRHALEKGNKISNENTLYMPIGNDGKSGAMIAYNFRLINGLSSAYFFSKDTIQLIKSGKINNLVLLDDIIATGEQSSKQLMDTAEKARKLGIQNIYLLTAFGYRTGIERLKETAVADVFSAVEYDESDTVMDLDSSFYEGLTHDKRERYWETFSKYYKGYGYGKIGGLITMYYNTPNCTVQMVWGSNDGWMPLFPRRFDLKNIGPELYEMDELIKEESEKEKMPKEECSIYVEGKTEELFLQALATINGNFGYKSVNIVSIGPFFSGSLIDSLKKYSTKYFFVTNGNLDGETGYSKSVKEATKDTELTKMEKVMGYFDKEKILSSEYFQKALGKGFDDNEMPDDVLNSLLENRLIKRAPAIYRATNMTELILNCGIEDKLNALVRVFQKEDMEKED